ncbi:MAG: GNAT family N-acetyltransferase [Dehalococcoidia bacterium]|nr:GNAT family N-acetyltransferase [Dehalococcoidia bacterium]
MQDEQQIARITLAARLDYVPAVMSFVHDICLKLGLDDKEAGRFELVVEEACVNVLEHAFDPGEQGAFDILTLRRPGQVVMAVEDQGLPFDFRKFESESESGLGVILMKAFADEVHFLNLGRQGKRVELVKNLPYKDIEAYVSVAEKDSAQAQPPAPADIKIAMRPMQPEDSMSLARCIYRCYGYTYAADYIYYPDRVKELLESGLLFAYVALNPEGDVIGHISLRRLSAESHIGERGQAVVDPRYRGHGLLGKLIGSIIEFARERGMYGMFSEAVTAHTFSQKAALGMGAVETGVLMGFSPASMSFKKIREVAGQRQTAMLMYTSCGGEPERDIYPPFHHEAMIRHIYGGGKLKRNIHSACDVKDSLDLPGNARVDVRISAEAGRAFLHVMQPGDDLVDLVKFRLKELCLRNIDCIYIDLPLSLPATQKFVAPLEMLGFFFSGIIPEMAEGDVLRLQYLNNVDLSSENPAVASDFGRELLDYVKKAKENS